MSDLPFLDESEAPEPVAEAQAEAPVAEPQGEPPAAPPAAVEEPKHVPITALLDERDKRQAFAREAEELRRKVAEYEAKAAQPAPEPDFFSDPEGYLSKVQQQFEHRLWNDRLNTSETLSRRHYGDSLVTEAATAFKEAAAVSPALTAELRNQADPYGYVVAWHKRQRVVSQMGDDPDAWIEAQVQARLAAKMPAQPNPAPRSLAAAPSASSTKEPVVSGFQSLFKTG